jgi:exodeoxyribonuclease VII small subunit
MRLHARGMSGEGGILPSAPAWPWQMHREPGLSVDMRTSDTQTSPPTQARASKITNRPSMPTMPRSSAAAPEPATYEQALAELEALVQAMEAGRLPLDQLLTSYKRGAELLQQCRARLQVVEDQVKILEDGQLKPWAQA